MVVTMCFAIVAAGAVTKIYFEHEAGIFQVAQRVIDGCVTDTGESPACGFEDLARGRVVITLLDNLENRLPLGRQLRFCFSFLLYVLQDGFRLILKLGIVKRALGFVRF